MYFTQRMWQHVPTQFERLTTLAIITALALSIGWAAGTYGPTVYTFVTTNNMPITAVVAPQPQAQQYVLGGHGELVAGANNALVAPIGIGSAAFTSLDPVEQQRRYNGQLYQSAHPVVVRASSAPIRPATTSQLFQDEINAATVPDLSSSGSDGFNRLVEMTTQRGPR